MKNILCLLLLIPLLGCSIEREILEARAPENTTLIEGSFTYRERIALPPGSVAVVELSDISRMDVAATVLSTERINLDGKNVPVGFHLEVPDEKLKSNGTYAVRVQIHSVDDRLLWTTDQVHSVASVAGAQYLAPITLIKVGGRSGIVGHWQVEFIGNRPIVDRSHTELVFQADGSLSGSTGCNRFTTRYRIRGDLLMLEPIAVTRRSCIPALGEQESRYLDILNNVDQHFIDPLGRLVLKSSEGGSLLATRL